MEMSSVYVTLCLFIYLFEIIFIIFPLRLCLLLVVSYLQVFFFPTSVLHACLVRCVRSVYPDNQS